jgi:hypothetical protein
MSDVSKRVRLENADEMFPRNPELAPCPECGSGAVRLQTPVEPDQMVRRAYFRCFACGLVSDDWNGWKPLPYPTHGNAPWSPLRDFWNAWAREFLERCGPEPDGCLCGLPFCPHCGESSTSRYIERDGEI